MTKKYSLIYADPPWNVKKIKRKCRPNQVDFDYPTLTLEQIKSIPVSTLADENCCLFLWTTQAYLPKAFEVMESWGFKYQRTITWDKQNGMCLFGFHNRTEFLLFGYRGKLDMYPKRKTIPTIFQISSKKLRHSQKPDEIRNAIEVFANNGNKIELFARSKSEGWDVWGNEVESDINLEVNND
jgi:N6-adenosine-specific RNA methylase IME4